MAALVRAADENYCETGNKEVSMIGTEVNYNAHVVEV